MIFFKQKLVDMNVFKCSRVCLFQDLISYHNHKIIYWVSWKITYYFFPNVKEKSKNKTWNLNALDWLENIKSAGMKLYTNFLYFYLQNIDSEEMININFLKYMNTVKKQSQKYWNFARHLCLYCQLREIVSFIEKSQTSFDQILLTSLHVNW